MSLRRRVIVFGIDGGSWDVILPLSQQGLLPAFKHLMASGTHAALNSTIPPSSFPAWTTAITGVNPGKHGIIDFTRRIPGQDKLVFLNSRHRGVPTIFEILSRRQRKVASLGIPCTSPPDPINGVMIGGFDCPVAVSADRSMVHPPELAGELFRKFDEYPYGSISEFRITPNWYAQARRILLKNIDKRETIFRWLWEKDRWDLFWMVFPETDTASHHFWSLHDPASPRHNPQLAQEFGDTLTKIYQRLDQVLQRFLDDLTHDDSLIVMSDHGFGSAGTSEIYPNLWLQQQGYLKFKFGSLEKRNRLNLIDKSLRVLPDRLPQWLFRTGARWMGSLESHRRFANIDWNHTVAFSEESNSFPGIWLRLEGRDYKGTVPSTQRNRYLDNISKQLSEWRCPITGQPLMDKVHRREDVFSGPYLSLIPDLILEPALIGGASVAIASSNRSHGESPAQQIPESRYPGGKGIGFSGTHRRQGIFLAYGTDLSAAETSEINIIDVSPLLLKIMGEPIPQWMEGVKLTSGSVKKAEAA